MKLPDPTSLHIVNYPDPVLKKKCAPVESFGDDVAVLAGRMLELMRGAEGVGLSAPQVGLAIRLFVCNPTAEPGDDLVCVNPRITDSDGTFEGDEGCLSLPGVTVTMRRASTITLEAFDVQGRAFTRSVEDLLARVVQHENDHLDGRLIIDSMSPTDEIANRRALKQLREDYAEPRRC